MKSYSYHFNFTGKTDYKDLAPVFPEILQLIMKENDHFQNEEDEESREMFIELNMSDIMLNRKPEGYNRKGKYRLIFPIGVKGFYIRTTIGKPNEIKRVAEDISDILSTSKVKFKLENGEDEVD